jgi:hypothetical protein
MMMGIIFAAAAVLILLFEVPALLKAKHKRDMTAFFVLFSIGAALSLAIVLHVRVPTPLEAMTAIYKPFSRLLFHLLE